MTQVPAKKATRISAIALFRVSVVAFRFPPGWDVPRFAFGDSKGRLNSRPDFHKTIHAIAKPSNIGILRQVNWPVKSVRNVFSAAVQIPHEYAFFERRNRKNPMMKNPTATSMFQAAMILRSIPAKPEVPLPV
jgi:hypothetical protein